MERTIMKLNTFILILFLAVAGRLPAADPGALATAKDEEIGKTFSYSASDDTNNPAFVAWQKEFGPTHEARMKWWREARFGMFIHWGVYAVPAGVWNGANVTNSGAEWIMNRGRIPVADYRKFPAQFNPTNFNAEAWVKLAKQAGMKYIVITAKHHDGFAMYHSKADPFNIFDATPFKRDPLKELAAACQKEGIKLGFYYSQAQDWNHPGGAAAGSKTGQPVIDKQNHWDAAQQGSMDEYLDQVAVPQMKELLTEYGPVAVLWWDTPVSMSAERALKLLPLLKLQPDIVSNNRLEKNKSFGDFSTPENNIPTNALSSDWETCMTMNKTWGYRSYDDNWKSTEKLVRNLVDIASKGGNFLLNIGPDAAGDIPDPSVERLKEIGAWMQVNGEAIYGTDKSPLKSQPAWGRVTQKGDTLYLHVFDWPKDGKLSVAGAKYRISSATLLATGEKLKTTLDADGATIAVPAVAPDKISSTIVLKLKKPSQTN
jgi:alpha-L-fucosidase